MWINAVDYAKIQSLKAKGYYFTGESRTSPDSGILQFKMEFDQKLLSAIQKAENNALLRRTQ